MSARLNYNLQPNFDTISALVGLGYHFFSEDSRNSRFYDLFRLAALLLFRVSKDDQIDLFTTKSKIFLIKIFRI